MQRDDDALEISNRLDAMYKEDNSKTIYNSIMDFANNSFNILITKDENDHHTIYWYKRNAHMSNSYDDDLHILLEHIKNVCR